MSKKEQVQPLSPAVHLINFDVDDDFHEELNQHPHRKYVKCCGCITALLLLLVVILLVLIFTVFWVKTPILRINSIRIEGLDRVNWTNVSPDTNLTVFADVSVKNPNMASFKYNNATTGLYYDGILIGEARTPPGSAPSRRTRTINVTIDVMVKNIMDVPRLQDDFIAGYYH